MLSIPLLQFFAISPETSASLVADEEHKVAGLTEIYTQYLQEGYNLQFTIVPEATTPDKIRIKIFGNLKTIRERNGVVQSDTSRFTSQPIFTKNDAHKFLSFFKNKEGVDIQGLNLLGGSLPIPRKLRRRS